MGAGAGQGCIGAGLHLEGTGRSRPCAALCGAGQGQGFRAGGGRRRLQAPGRAGCGGQAVGPPGAAAMTRACGFAAIIGAPNAGKSTLINALVGSKVAIVTPKVQTTRALLRGIAMAGPAQLVLIDTPGIFAPRRRLDRAMVTTAWSGAHDA